MTFPDTLPKLCPGCGSPYSEDWVGGWYWNGWTCGSYSVDGAQEGDSPRFCQVMPCAILHWKTRALKAEAELDWLESAAWTDSRIGNGLVLWPYTRHESGERGFSLQDLGDEDGSGLGEEIANAPTLRACIAQAKGSAIIAEAAPKKDA